MGVIEEKKKLCCCGRADKHLPHCPLNEIGIDFSDFQKVLERIEKDFRPRKQQKPRDPKRIPKIMKRLEKLWKKHPDLRLGQLLENALRRDAGFGSPYYMEDENLIEVLERFYENKNPPQK